MYNAYVIYVENISQRKCQSLYEFTDSVICSFLSFPVEVGGDSDSDPQCPSSPKASTLQAVVHDPESRLDEKMKNNNLEQIKATSKKVSILKV